MSDHAKEWMRLMPALAAALVTAASAGARTVEIPFDAADFPALPQIDNPYWSLPVGASFVYFAETEDECTFSKVVVTEQTRPVVGVTTRVVRDQEWIMQRGDAGCDASTAVLEEDTLDYYAEDFDGNVWYFGEDTLAVDLETGECSAEGAWEAGAGEPPAQPGIVMLADPRPGDRYRQELAEGVAEDMAAVLRLGDSVSTGLDDFSGCLETKEWTPLEPGAVEHKFYCLESASGLFGGLVAIDELMGKTVHVELIGGDLPGAFPGDGEPFPALDCD